MNITDIIYGTFEITDPLIMRLINSNTLKRLATISMFGVPDEFYHLKNYSRFEHSIGVMLLLRKLHASREEQVAGLLHDISHTAFSHVVDWVVGSGKTEDYQDNIHLSTLIQSDVAPLLEHYGFSPKRIADYHQFPLLEQPAPDLCADRLDYGLREIPRKAARMSIDGLVVLNNSICFKDKKSAYAFAHHYLKRQAIHWGGFEAVSRYRLFADALKLALHDKLITFSDLMKEEAYIISKLASSKNIKLQTIMSALSKKSLANFPKSANVYHKKFRYVDPKIVSCNNKRLSEVDTHFKIELDKERKKNTKGIQIAQIFPS